MGEKMTYRTFRFGNVAVWKSEFRGTLSAPGHPNVEVGNPLVFKGSGEVWCTDDLLIRVLNACPDVDAPSSDATSKIGSIGVREQCPRHARAP
jgi:hypothetical protein